MTEPLPPRPSREERDAALFRAIYDAQLDYVWRTLRRLGIREADIQDVAHEVLLTVYRRLSDYDPERPVRAWLFGFCFRVASDHRKRPSTAREFPEESLEIVDDAPLPDEKLAAEQARALVLQALDGLEIARRAVFVMHEIDGHAVPEIARTLEIPLNTAYSRLRLAREEFARTLPRLTVDQPDQAIARRGHR